MFTLCGLILEARENLFRNFWSPFSISFYFSSARNIKKTNRPTGRVRLGLRPEVAFISRPSPGGETLAPAPPCTRARRRRLSPPPPLATLPPPGAAADRGRRG